MKQSAFYWDELCMWHGGGYFSGGIATGGYVQPTTISSLPETQETKRRLKSIMEVSGLINEFEVLSADLISEEDLLRVHPQSYLSEFKALSDAGGGDLGHRLGDASPFGPGGYDMARQSAGLALRCVEDVARGTFKNGYALCRPPGHHCLPDIPNGYCLLANGALAIEAARAKGLMSRVAIVDWDVHHGNGTEAIYWDDPNVLTISLHQDRNYPQHTGDFVAEDFTARANLNIPIAPGSGHETILRAMDRVILPALTKFAPDFLLVSSGYDAGALDVLSRTQATTATFRALTKALMDVTAGPLALIHEGGYSEQHVPFMGHGVLEVLATSKIQIEDPMEQTILAKQTRGPVLDAMNAVIDEIALSLAF